MSQHTLAELTRNFVAYRQLEPFDARVPGVREAWREMGLAGSAVVRKRDADYPKAAAWILRRFHELHAPGVEISEMLLIGDTLGNDGGAYRRLAEYTGWQGAAFIGSEKLEQAPAAEWQGGVYLANRWQSLADWLRALETRGLRLADSTIVVVDIDKTALGARGRNNRPIDATRLLGMRQTVQQALGPDADLDAFSVIYNELNRSIYHDLTGDNQDYLAYISIMVGADVVPPVELQALTDFGAFVGQVQMMADRLPPALAKIHENVFAAFRAGDPTPFKDFRRNEYRAAVVAMGNLSDDAPDAERLDNEICLTSEVWDACKWLQQRGALITALSDKPDEACAPTTEFAALGYQPIHQTPTHLLGEPLSL